VLLRVNVAAEWHRSKSFCRGRISELGARHAAKQRFTEKWPRKAMVTIARQLKPGQPAHVRIDRNWAF
jgi:hypothetical protein